MTAEHQTRSKIVGFLEQAGLGSAADISIVELAQGGSNRRFYRVRHAEGSWVVMLEPGEPGGVSAYADIGKFLFDLGVGVPEINAFDARQGLLLMEDLGNDSLQAVLQRASGRDQVLEHYQAVLTELAGMQVRTAPYLSENSALQQRTFGYEAFRWETDYFLERFISQFCGLSVEKRGALEQELQRLAETLDAEPRFFMHRDFQSQNVYIKEGRVRLIDFQTATRGLLQYDLVSLLKDAYFTLEEEERTQLLHFYMDTLLKSPELHFDRSGFITAFHLAGLQRNMQALGAFAFLGMQKGKKEFLQYIPAGLDRLREGLALFPEFEALGRLVRAAGCRTDKTYLKQ